jgi:hypothetical protein
VLAKPSPSPQAAYSRPSRAHVIGQLSLPGASRRRLPQSKLTEVMAVLAG